MNYSMKESYAVLRGLSAPFVKKFQEPPSLKISGFAPVYDVV